MHWLNNSRTQRVIVPALGVWLACCASLFAEPIRPEFETLEQIVQQYFYHARPRHKPMLLTQSQVVALLESLQGMRIYIPGRTQIVRSFPHDREFFSRFVLEELAQEPAIEFPDDPTFLFQRIDAMCTSRQSIVQLTRLASQGKSFSATWISDAPLLPSLESRLLKDLLAEHGVENAAQAKPRRRNYTIEHLLEALESAYLPASETATTVTSFDAVGR
ncbi:hypothetical protein C5Y96_26855 [Blastopirellula marina]|uniref:Uncharacterized protein n=1 Tax=Blastopirellula marina TaxID=124 RepID=A0A2S8EZ26_9BACT|nr:MULTISPECIES: hypothetical protein [Pirellulaceae]PQO25121.1 hypothetical protein C5Y96_26855 [Blastopirellula marina]RCS40972.1 hypothetical protein DTL36_26900 [Bremerella cremea]